MNRFQAWALRSRARYALVWGGMQATFVCSIAYLPRLSERPLGRVLVYTAVGFTLCVLGHALLGYPRAKRRAAPASTGSRSLTT